MDIKVSYQPTAKELMKASSIYVEKKPFFLLLITLMNAFAVFIFVVICFKLFKVGALLPEEWMGACMALIWLFARRPLNEWLLLKRLEDSKILEVPIEVTLTLNGIMWAGKGLAPGHMPWKDIPYVFEVKNGLVVPNASTRYLWLPYRGFKTTQDVTELLALFDEKKIIRRKYPKWEC